MNDRIRRNNLKKRGITEPQQQVVGCHVRLLAAGLGETLPRW